MKLEITKRDVVVFSVVGLPVIAGLVELYINRSVASAIARNRA